MVSDGRVRSSGRVGTLVVPGSGRLADRGFSRLVRSLPGHGIMWRHEHCTRCGYPVAAEGAHSGSAAEEQILDLRIRRPQIRMEQAMAGAVSQVLATALKIVAGLGGPDLVGP